MNTNKKVLMVALSLAMTSCGIDSSLEDPGLAKAELKPEELTQCKVKVGDQELDMETEYLPKIIACENDAADWEAMLANVIAARTYGYYVQHQSGKLYDNDRDQTYRCTNPVTETIREAIRTTSGQVITYKGNLIASFYVLGAKPAKGDESCIGVGSSGSEKYVTYNEDNYGDDVTRSRIGSKIDANRGCMSQLGAECLSDLGYDHMQILEYFYGDGIRLEGAKCQGVDSLKFPMPESKGISLSCDGECDLSNHDCVYTDDIGFECVPKSEHCTKLSGDTMRQCGCTGWEFCTSKDEWSGKCEESNGFFDCTIPEDIISSSCEEECNLSTHDCLYRAGKNQGYECVEKSSSCEAEEGQLIYRECGCGGYQSCELDYGFEGTYSWSTDCKDSEGMFGCIDAPDATKEPTGPVSATCDGCDLGINDCFKEDGKYKCEPKSDQCEPYGGTTFKQCECDGWMFCMPSGVWSGNCGDAPSGLFECR